LNKNNWPWITNIDYKHLYNSINNWPKISIVIPSFNQGEYIEETIRSIILQEYPNIELIIIDGGSKDSTLDIINKYKDFVNVLISEKDNGQSDAINKGWKLVTGDITNWLNSDDYLSEKSLYNIAYTYNNSDKNSLIVGNVINFDEKKLEVIIKQKNITYSNLIKFWDSNCVWHQPGIFFPRTCVMNQLLNQDFHYAMDLDLLLSLTAKTNVIYLNEVIHYFRLHNNSKGISFPEKTVLEKIQISGNHINTDFKITFTDKLKLFIWLFKTSLKLILNLKLKGMIIIIKETYLFYKKSILF
jgi:glycosyltransferase involved in cell wall biosynthesis